MLTRRTVLRSAAGVVFVPPRLWAASKGVADPLLRLDERFRMMESRAGGRLGVSVRDLASGHEARFRGHERFPICSVFKLLAVGGVLSRVDRGQESLDRPVHFSAASLVAYSPETSQHAGLDGMTLGALCEAAITRSDNTAGNLLLEALGGLAGFNRYLRNLGDTTTRLDRTEPTLNEALPGDPRDTTTPDAMVKNLRALLFGEHLSEPSRARLVNWLRRNQTGGARLRAGLPTAWQVGDKTGSGERGTTNDVGVLWPPGRSPLLVAVFLTGASEDSEKRNAVIADVARAIATAVS